MKVFSFLLLTLFAFSAEARRIQTPEAYAKTLQIRGGGAIGPLDGDLAMQLSKTVTTAYIAGSASKFIAAQTGGGSTQVRKTHPQSLCCLHRCALTLQFFP